MKDLSKRAFIKTILLGAFSLSNTPTVTKAVVAQEKPAMMIKHLVDALISTNKPACKTVAAKLLLLKDNNANFDLHLRSADLNNDEIKRIAEAIKTVHDNHGPSLHSFSMSYNEGLGDEGVLSLVKNLPSTLTEIGLVGCNIGDEGGEALLAWATQAPTLHWLCIEHNNFSADTKSRLKKLGETRRNLLIVI